MNVADDISPDASQEHISQLVSNAQELGEADGRSGKRRWPRYKAGMQLDVTSDPADPSDVQAVIMHNVSGGGFSFWSKRLASQGETLHVREFSDDGSTEWLPARVRHCTVGILGYLIGAHFEHPVHASDDEA